MVSLLVLFYANVSHINLARLNVFNYSEQILEPHQRDLDILVNWMAWKEVCSHQSIMMWRVLVLGLSPLDLGD